MSSSSSGGKDYREGPEASERFNRTVSRILTVSKDELAKRETAYQQSRYAKKRYRKRS